jgi:2-deoxy-D-gluconate 3-dehydrogenase
MIFMNNGDLFSLTGKNAIITGGAMGIGHGIAERFVESGANVLLADVNEKAVEEAAEILSGVKSKVVNIHSHTHSENSNQVIPMQADISDPGMDEKVVENCINNFGSVDILVNNAGIYPQVPMLDMTPELFDKVLDVNLKGLAFLSKAAGTKMEKQKNGGKIINIASIDSFHPSMVGLAAYDASKGGVVSFTKNFALEMGPKGVLVNGIAPGGVTTEGTEEPLEGSGMTAEEMKEVMKAFASKIPLGRMGVPDDIAKVAVFLASSAADYITGETIVVDGGILLA